jgi:hypothetical protein
VKRTVYQQPRIATHNKPVLWRDCINVSILRRMVGIALFKVARGLCLICLCILGVAIIIGFMELLAAPILLKATGCSPTEILPGFNCGRSWVNRLIEIVLDLPSMFLLAVALSIFPTTSPPSRGFMLLLYLFDVILLLAVTYPLLVLLARKGNRYNT